MSDKNESTIRLDLACGQNKREGFTGVDAVEMECVDIVCDLESFPWQWEDNSVDELHCSHYIEHTSDLTAFMDECWRILKPGGQMTVVAPYYTSVRCWQDPTHKRAISENTFLYYNKGWREEARLSHYAIKADFDFSYGYSFAPEWAVRSDTARQFALKHYWNVVADLMVTLTKRSE